MSKNQSVLDNMAWAVREYRAGRYSLFRFVNVLERLLEQIENPSDMWVERFRFAWIKLELVNADIRSPSGNWDDDTRKRILEEGLSMMDSVIAEDPTK